jgi:hypothetical protein
VPVGSYCYIEARVFVSATVGTVDVWVDGVLWLTLTSQNTKNTANSTMAQIAISSASNVNNHFDDLYVADATTSKDRLGDQRVETDYPIADGYYSTWTPSTGTAHYSLINSAVPQTTTFVSDGTPGNKDSYVIDPLTAITGAIAGVQWTIYADKSDAGARSIKIDTRSNVTDAAGATQALGTSPALYSEVRLTDPNTSAAWTQAGVNAAQPILETV